MALTNRVTHNGVTFNVSPRHAAALELLMETNGGGFATVKGYVSTSDRIVPEKADIQFISRFKVENLYARRRAALEAITFADVYPLVKDHPKVAALDESKVEAIFNERKAKEIASIDKTASGDRDDAHRAAHDRNYLTVVPGVKTNWITEKNDEGLQIPVLDSDGFPTVGSIMLNIIQVNKTVIEPGEYKVVNSGVPVILSNAIKSLLPKSCKMKTISLKENNFDSLAINGMELLAEQFKGL